MLLAELKRRNVFRVATFYVVAGWVLLQAGDLLFDTLGVPAWSLKLLLGLLVLGFPLALVFAWVYELTPEGLKREHEVERHASVTARTAARLDRLTIVLLVVAIGLLAADRLTRHADERAPAAAPVASSGPGGTAARRVPATQVSIAVLPFLNLSEDKSNEYFSDGLTEELLNVLANVPGLRVIARTSSFSYKGKDVSIADVARELAVDHVLEGSVRKSGNRVRITTQLIRASDSSHLWSENYDRNLDDIFAVQDEISRHVVDVLRVKLLPGEERPIGLGGTRNPQAYDAFLLGRHKRSLGEMEASLRASIEAYDEAIRLDPDYAQAYAGKAAAVSALASNAYVPFDTGFGEVQTLALRALELEPNLAEGHVALGFVETFVNGDIRKAVASFERALELDPGNAEVQRYYSTVASAIRRHDAAIAAARRAVALDPLSTPAHITLSTALALGGRPTEAEAVARRALALQPDRPGGPATLGWALTLQGRSDEALAAFDAEPIEWQRRNGRSVVLARMGRVQEARRELAVFQKKFGDNAAFQYAEAEAQLGDRDAAIRWLEKAREIKDPGLLSLGFVDPMLEPLHDDPRHRRLFAELGFDLGAS